mmetsp:Transcript_13363/g.1958  ORF Transcript_13363/g.1958 Transcript_13363/m.1958 type:complete len:127 (-) Transcript_13363:111-491(-)
MGFEEDDLNNGKKGKGKKGKGKKGPAPAAKNININNNNNNNNQNDDNNDDNDEDVQENEDSNQVPASVMDEYIKEAFLNCLKISVTDKILPLDPSILYSTHMLTCKNEAVTVDIKNSSYKKIGKFV